MEEDEIYVHVTVNVITQLVPNYFVDGGGAIMD
jgi:hypothetical protein